MIRYARSHQLDLNFMGIITEEDSVEVQVERLKKSWEHFRVQEN